MNVNLGKVKKVVIRDKDGRNIESFIPTGAVVVKDGKDVVLILKKGTK